MLEILNDTRVRRLREGRPPEELSHPVHPREQQEGALSRRGGGEDGEGRDVRQKLREVFTGGASLG